MCKSAYIRIIEYEPRHAKAFRDLNLSWIEEYFEVEEIDRQQLSNSEDTIIEPGGAIFIAEDHRGVLGVCGLRYDSPGRYEVNKMAVREDMRGRGYRPAPLIRSHFPCPPVRIETDLHHLQHSARPGNLHLPPSRFCGGSVFNASGVCLRQYRACAEPALSFRFIVKINPE